MKIKIQNIDNLINKEQKINKICLIDRGNISNYTSYYSRYIYNNILNPNFFQILGYGLPILIKVTNDNVDYINKLLDFRSGISQIDYLSNRLRYDQFYFDADKGFQVDDMIYFLNCNLPSTNPIITQNISKFVKHILINNYYDKINDSRTRHTFNYAQDVSKDDKYNCLLNYYNKMLLINSTQFEYEDQNNTL